MNRSACLALALVTSACSGVVSEPGERPPQDRTGPDGPGQAHTCVPGEMPIAPLRRIDRATYVGALREVFGAESVEAVASAVSTLPATQVGDDGYRSETGPISMEELEATLSIATALAFHVTDGERLAALRPCLADLSSPVDAQSDDCLGAFVDDYGRRLTRRPLSAEDRARFLAAYEIGAAETVREGVATILMEMLIDPRFLYFPEVDGEEVEEGLVALTSHELAARLARTLFGSSPDEELMAAADAGLDDELLAEQAARMWEDDRARAPMRRFFADWLALEDSAGGRTEALLSFAETMTFEEEATYGDLFLDRTAFITNEAIAVAYGYEPDFRGEVELPADQRAGLLTRPGWLETMPLSDTNAGHIIHRGVKLSRLNCQPLPPPDPGLFPSDDPAAAADASQTIRERFRTVTAQPQCVSCHEQLDGYGGPFGHYGATGEWIATEEIEREDGSVLSLDIDASGHIEAEGGQRSVEGAVELSAALAEDPAAAECLAQNFTRHVVGRALHPSDGCLVARASEVLVTTSEAGGSVRDAVLAIVTSPEFRTHRLAEEE
jgi:hypothetical protein